MSFALPTRQITFGRTDPASQQQQPYQLQQQQQQPYQQHGLALPGGNPYLSQQTTLFLDRPRLYPIHSFNHKCKTGLRRRLPLPMPLQDHRSLQPPFHLLTPHLEQQHMTAVEGIVPTLQNIVVMENLDCRLI